MDKVDSDTRDCRTAVTFWWKNSLKRFARVSSESHAGKTQTLPRPTLRFNSRHMALGELFVFESLF
jgi:hypothetical protein